MSLGLWNGITVKWPHCMYLFTGSRIKGYGWEPKEAEYNTSWEPETPELKTLWFKGPSSLGWNVFHSLPSSYSSTNVLEKIGGWISLEPNKEQQKDVGVLWEGQREDGYSRGQELLRFSDKCTKEMVFIKKLQNVFGQTYLFITHQLSPYFLQLLSQLIKSVLVSFIE